VLIPCSGVIAFDPIEFFGCFYLAKKARCRQKNTASKEVSAPSAAAVLVLVLVLVVVVVVVVPVVVVVVVVVVCYVLLLPFVLLLSRCPLPLVHVSGVQSSKTRK
jgi:hypothetical protein